MKLNPRYGVEYPTELAWAYMNLGQYEKALEALDKAYSIHPDYLQVHVEAALAYLAMWETQQTEDSAVLD